MPSVSQLLTNARDLLAQTLAFLGVRAPQWDSSDTGFAGKIARAFTALKLSNDKAVRQLDADWPLSSASSKEAIVRQCDLFGRPNGAGGYGLRVATKARGGVAVAQGAGGTNIPLPQLLWGPDGITVFELRAPGPYTTSGVFPGTGQVNVTIDAVTPGTAGNLSAGQQLTWQSTPLNILPTVTLISKLTDGLDEEDPDKARQDLTQRLQTPPKGGAPQDFRAWGDVTTDTSGTPYGTLRTYGYSGGDESGGAGGGYDGLSAVMLVVTQIGSGLARLPSMQQLQDVPRYVRGSTSIEGRSPICAAIRAVAPFMERSVTGLIPRARVVPSMPLYKFDWRRGTTVYTVDPLGWDGTSKLRLTGLAPDDLKLAILNGQLPSIYVDTRDGSGYPTGPVIPAMAKCIAFADSLGKTTLTLQTPLPIGWTGPSGGDEVYAGQELICAASGASGAILAYIDSLGPSRISGLQDPTDIWSDTCAIQGGLDTAAKNVLADDGISPLISQCILGGVTIAVGNGAQLAQDVRAPDNSTFGPGMLYALRILVTD